jgi:cob(I)alamin adenosyltransferase
MDEQKKKTGLIHIYCGDGKGKTTAATGLIVRAAGHGLRVMLVQFLKNGSSGEIDMLRNLPDIRVLAGQPTNKFTINMTEREKQATREVHRQYFTHAVDAAMAHELDLLVFDEAMGAISTGLLDERHLLEFLRDKPSDLEVVLTGRDPSPDLLELADYISYIRCDRHPYQRGIMAREGIEY